MKFVPIINATRVFGPPEDMNGYCGSLHIRDEHVTNTDPETGAKQDFGNFMVSAWKPSTEELSALLNGAVVTLHIRGVEHPVVMMGVES